jgi:hypothetical protein
LPMHAGMNCCLPAAKATSVSAKTLQATAVCHVKAGSHATWDSWASSGQIVGAVVRWQYVLHVRWLLATLLL